MTSERIAIVRAGVGDARRLAPLFDAYRIFYGAASDPSAAIAFLEARLGRGESVAFLAVADGRDAGFTQLYPSFSSVGVGPIWILNDLYVAADARRGGVGRALLAAGRDHARATGALRVELSTARTNAAAKALYERFGFVRDEVFDRYALAV